MGWTQQGYNTGFNPTLNIKSDHWYVENNDDETDEVEKYHEQQPDIGHWCNKVKIVYGMSGREYFRGYILTQDLKIAKRLLRSFNGFLCYAHKYGGEKQFKSGNMMLFPFLDLILFYEMNPKDPFFNHLISFDRIITDLLGELKFGIRHKFINDFGKTVDEIKAALTLTYKDQNEKYEKSKATK